MDVSGRSWFDMLDVGRDIAPLGFGMGIIDRLGGRGSGACVPKGVFARVEYEAVLIADVDNDGDIARCIIEEGGE
jgi:hypothetical protein